MKVLIIFWRMYDIWHLKTSVYFEYIMANKKFQYLRAPGIVFNICDRKTP